MTIYGTLISYSEKTENGLVYSKDSINNSIKKFIENSNKFGYFNYATEPINMLQSISHVIEDIKIKEDCIEGKASILNTEKGNIVKYLLNNNVNLTFIPRFIGNIDDNKNVNINHFLSFDLSMSTTDLYSIKGYKNKRYKFYKES